MHTGSFDWWFRNRNTDKITIVQFPNWPLFAIGIGWVIRRIAAEGTNVHDVVGGAVIALWLYWGSDEVVRGVNPWRRALGLVVIVATVAGAIER